MRKCRACGCTDRKACVNLEVDKTCEWVAEDLCSFCAIVINFYAAREDEPVVGLYSEGDLNLAVRTARVESVR